MDLKLTEEHRLIRDMARDFAQKEIAPIAAEIDEAGQLPNRDSPEDGRTGLYGHRDPGRVGRHGHGHAELCAGHDRDLQSLRLAWGDHVGQQLAGLPRHLYLWHRASRKRRFWMPLASGEKLGAYSLTEPQAGSDPANMRCTAEYDRRDGRVCHQWPESLGDQRSQCRLYHPLCHDRQEPGPPGHLGLYRRHHAAWLFPGKSGAQTGDPSVSYFRVGLRGLSLAGLAPAGRGGSGVQDRPVRSSMRGGLASLPRRWALPRRPLRRPATMPRSGSSLASPSPASRPSSGCWPT